MFLGKSKVNYIYFLVRKISIKQKFSIWVDFGADSIGREVKYFTYIDKKMILKNYWFLIRSQKLKFSYGIARNNYTFCFWPEDIIHVHVFTTKEECFRKFLINKKVKYHFQRYRFRWKFWGCFDTVYRLRLKICREIEINVEKVDCCFYSRLWES